MGCSTVTTASTPVLLAQVAAAANVSIAQASRALNGQPNVSEATRAHIQTVAKQMGYQPNRVAQQLRGVNSRQVILIVSDAETFDARAVSNYFGLLLRGLFAGLSEANCSPTLITVDAINEFTSYPIAAVITCTQRRDTIDAVCSTFTNVPIITAGHEEPTGNIYSTSYYDIAHWTTRCADLLIERGATNIALLINPAALELFYDPCASAYHQWCVANGQPAITADAMFSDDTFATAQTMLTDTSIDGIICFGPPAHSVIAAATGLGRTIPDDCLLISWGTAPALAEYTSPSLSTIDLNPLTAAALAVDALADALIGVRHHISLPVSITERDSTRPLLSETHAHD
jgi:LacI family transcriptional regulator